MLRRTLLSQIPSTPSSAAITMVAAHRCSVAAVVPQRYSAMRGATHHAVIIASSSSSSSLAATRLLSCQRRFSATATAASPPSSDASSSASESTSAPSSSTQSHSTHPLYEGLPRYPELTVMGGFRALDYMGTCAFAVSGSLCAATYGLNALGCITVGSITALGGGTVRDVVFGRGGAFWIEEWEYVAMAIACAGATFAMCYHYDPTPATMEAYEAVMFWADTIGLGAFAVIGTLCGCRMGLPPLLILVCTVMTCTGGGIIRDLLVRRPVRVLNNYAEAYAETTLCGGAAYLGMRMANVHIPTRVILAASVVVVLRCLAASNNFALPQANALRKSWAVEHKA